MYDVKQNHMLNFSQNMINERKFKCEEIKSNIDKEIQKKFIKKDISSDEEESEESER